MQKQAAFILTMSTMPDYLILDEPIDGLDPLIRKRVCTMLPRTVRASDDSSRIVPIAKWGICDYIGILSGGRMVIEEFGDSSDIHKVQVALGTSRNVRFRVEHPAPRKTRR